MADKHDYRKDWEKTKKQLLKFSKEAMEVVKKGEEELIKLTKKSKFHIDSTAISLKKEKLYYLIGKEYVKAEKGPKGKEKIKKLVSESKAADKEWKELKEKIKKNK